MATHHRNLLRRGSVSRPVRISRLKLLTQSQNQGTLILDRLRTPTPAHTEKGTAYQARRR